jgi:hypothetical protein
MVNLPLLNCTLCLVSLCLGSTTGHAFNSHAE